MQLGPSLGTTSTTVRRWSCEVLRVADLDDPSSAWILALHQYEGKIPDAHQRLEALLAGIDTDREWWILIDAADGAPIADPADEPTWITRLVDAATRTRVPSLMVAAKQMLGHMAIVRRSDYGGAELYREALAVAFTTSTRSP